MPHEDTANFRIEDLDDEEEEVEETPAATNTAHQTPAVTPVKRHRKKPNGVGVAAPQAPAWHYQEAELLWPEVLEDIKRRGMSAYDFCCRVSRLQPELMQMGSAFECSAIMGSETVTPGDALIEYVTEHYHLPLSQGPQRYDIAFVQKVGAKIYARGRLSLLSAAEIMAMRSANLRLQQQKLPNQVGVGAPPPPPAPYQPPPTYAQPSYPVPQSTSDEVSFLRQQLQRLESNNEAMRQEVLNAAREGRQPIIQPAQPEDRISRLEKLVEKLIESKATPAVGVGAPPTTQVAAAETASGVSSLKTMFDNFREVKGMFKQAREIFAEEEDDDGDEPEDNKQPVVATPEKKEDPIPFEVAELPTSPKWSNGEPVRYARNKETGDIDWLGAAMANPHVAEKAVDIVNRVGEAIVGAAKRYAGQQEQAVATPSLPTGMGRTGGEGGGSPPATPSI